jgi:uncharacterized Fe-S radical SAM superfamily protein PflX
MLSQRMRPAYLSLGSTELRRRAERALATLAECRACPRDCAVNRLEDKWAACKTASSRTWAATTSIS